MTLSGLWEWFFQNIGMWLVIAYSAFGIIEAVKDGSFGKAVTKLAIGVAAYYYGSNPQQVMDSLKGVVAKISG